MTLFSPLPRKVLLVTSPRSGTHLLATCLDSHPACRFYGELMDERWRKSYHGYPSTLDHIWTRNPPNLPVVGCVLHTTQGYSNHQYAFGIWPRISREPDLHIIRLQRANPLRRLVSHLLSVCTNTWNKHKKVHRDWVPEDLTVNCSMDQIEQEKRRLEVEDKFVTSWIGHLPTCYVRYEGLCANPKQVMKRVWSFCGLQAPHHPRFRTRQIRGKELPQLISNFQELSLDLKGHPWERYLWEDPTPEI